MMDNSTTTATMATATTATTYNTRSMMNLCSIDPPKYGWTACGGIASILDPHEMARRREAKETFLIRQREQQEEAKKHENEAAILLESRRSGQEGSNDGESPQKKTLPPVKKYYTITEPAAVALPSENNNINNDKKKSSDTPNNKNSSNSNIDNDQNMMNKITIQKMNKETGLIDIYTYHQGRVGDEVRDPKTGELLCDSDPVDTNYKWVPPKMIVKVTVSFPLGDPDEEEYQDSDLSDNEEDASQNNNNNKGEIHGGDSMMRSTPTRSSISKSRHRSLTDGNSLSGSPDKIDKSADKELPRFVQTVDWDLGDPSVPTAEEYAAKIASEFGLTFPQTMDLEESIQKQLTDFTHRQPDFYAPIKILDPYGNERPNAAFGPPELHCGSVRGSVSKPSIRRSASGASSSRRSTGGGGPSSSSRGAVKPDRRGISVIPKDQIEGPNQSGNKFAEEILKRCKQSSRALSAELISNGQAALSIQKNEVCHICHNRKETVLCFPCGRHAYCDYHCGSRLSLRAGDYDPKNPTSLPIDYCPVCTLHCTCSRCIRRLENLAGKLEEQCNKQQCGPGEVVMEGLTQLCADGSRHQVTNTKKKSKDKDKKRRRSDEGDDTPRPPTASRSSRTSPILLEDDKPPPPKKRKNEPIGPVPVLKVHPSEFPVELLGLVDADPSDPDDFTKIFTPGGAFDAEDSSSPGFPIVAKAVSKYQDIIEVQIERSFLMNCALCTEEGSDERICCSNCPRAYHTKCFEQSTSSTSARECNRCGNDREILPEDEILESIAVNEKIKSAYSHLAKSTNFTFCGVLLSQILDILEKLKGYDYGWVFAEPVNTDEVQDYLEVIKRPMDYSTIAQRLEHAEYGLELEQSSADGVDGGMDSMEVILLNVLCDVDQVHQNCFIYNLKDSAFYRAGIVQHKKWNAYLQKYIKERLSGSPVQAGFDKFRLNCEQALVALKNGQRFIKPKHGNGVNCRQYAVFDPDTKRIIKQYTSRASARLAALALLSAGYQCEWDLTEQNAKTRVENARDPSKLLFGYQWIPTDELKSGKFKMKEADRYVHNDEQTSEAATTTVLILKEDTVSGSEIRGFESEESAYQDWLQERASSVAASDDNAEDSNISAFVKSYLDGQASINGIIWKRILPRNSPVPEISTNKLSLSESA